MAVITGASGGSASSIMVDPEVQKTNIESVERIIIDITNVIRQMDDTINELVANGMVGSAIEVFLNNYANNREAISKYVKMLSAMTLDFTDFVNTSIETDEKAGTLIQ